MATSAFPTLKRGATFVASLRDEIALYLPDSPPNVMNQLEAGAAGQEVLMPPRNQSDPTDDSSLLGRFVATIGAWDDLLALPEEVPAELRACTDEDYGGRLTRWQPILSPTSPTAADALEAMLPAPLPPLYRRLALTYRYLEVELANFSLLANPPSEGLRGLTEAMFRDPILSGVLLRHGFIRFGFGSKSNYDPVCFDTSERRSGGDLRVVRLDHEQILCYERIRVVETLAPTFRQLVEDTIEQDRKLLAQPEREW
jgi:hypothetical protein